MVRPYVKVIVFLWICNNIEYDISIFFGNSIYNVDTTPNGAFKNGKTICEGYSLLFKEICEYLKLEVKNISGYSKGYGYKPGDEFKTKHLYNAINLDNKWYLIDSTWGAGKIEEKDYLKRLNEFYFCPNPEILIRTHFPDNEKWQLKKNIL